MAFPNIMFGPLQERFNMYGTTDRQGHYAGQILNTEDGRQFRWAKNGAATLVAGDLLQAPARITNHISQTPATAGIIGDTSLSVTLGATAMTADQYRDGYLLIGLGTGFGYAYTLDSHGAVGSAAATGTTLQFKRGESLQVAVPTTANSVSFVQSPYVGVIQAPVTTLTAMLVGVAIKPLVANAWGWIQTKGPAAVTTSGTLIIGNPAGYIAVAGAFGPLPTTFVADMGTQRLGTVMHVATTTNKSLVFLDGLP